MQILNINKFLLVNDIHEVQWITRLLLSRQLRLRLFQAKLGMVIFFA